jgi:hypothetical protein
MGRNGVTIQKFSLRGKHLKTYVSISDALQKENLNRYFLLKSISSGKPINNALFSYSSEPPVKKSRLEELKSRVTKKEAPWIGSNGLFDIAGWAQACK